MVEVVNIVGAGSLNEEIDLEKLSADITSSIVDYNPEKYPGLYLRFDEEGPLVTLYRTGKYIITGASSKTALDYRRKKLLRFLEELSVIDTPVDDKFLIQNIVAVGELTQNPNLNTLAIGLGLEDTEYEPEQFPGLVYRGQDEYVCLIFSSGNVVITGTNELNKLNKIFEILEEEISKIL